MLHASPNSSYDHDFVIVRVIMFHGLEVPDESCVVVKKVVWTQEVAEAEVARLNQLNQDKGCVYFWQIIRLERKGTE